MIDLLEYLLNSGHTKQEAKAMIENTHNAIPNEQWQDRAREIITQSHNTLQQLEVLRRYLNHTRGLSDNTISRFQLGFNAQNIFDNPSQWGLSQEKKVFVGRGFTIPHLIGDTIYNLKVRLKPERLFPNGRTQKYSGPKDGATCLFNADNLIPTQPLVICEGEFDTMLLWQHCSDFASVASINGATKGIPEQWLLRMIRHKYIFVAYDNDDAGNNGSQKLLNTIARARSISVPQGNDLTDFWREGGDLSHWLKYQLKLNGVGYG